jgi:hypothetical protein
MRGCLQHLIIQGLKRRNGGDGMLFHDVHSRKNRRREQGMGSSFPAPGALKLAPSSLKEPPP